MTMMAGRRTMARSGSSQPRLFDPRTDPMACEHREERETSFCLLHRCYTSCGQSKYGEPPLCAFEEPDNSEEARRRRLEWIKENE